MKKFNQTAEFMSQRNFDLEIENHVGDIQVTLDDYGNIKITDYSAASEMTYIEIMKSKRDVIENNIFYMNQFL